VVTPGLAVLLPTIVNIEEEAIVALMPDTGAPFKYKVEAFVRSGFTDEAVDVAYVVALISAV
jgi:hypothetical protein